MMLIFLCIVSACFLLTDGLPLSDIQQYDTMDLDPTQCATELRKAGASEKFAHMVAHDIHSLTMDDLKKFDPMATENNFVPTINIDLRADQAILPYAPDLKTNDTDKFLTDGMKAFDLVLTHMDDRHWDIVGFSTLEKLAHQFHMREIWVRVKLEFDKIGQTVPAPSRAACKWWMWTTTAL